MHPVHELAATFVDELAAAQPMAATYMGIPGHDHRWDDLSEAGTDALRELAVSQAARLRALPGSDDPWDRLAVEVIGTVLADELAWYEAGEHLLDLNSVSSPAQDLREVFDHMGTATAAGWEAIASRLEGLGGALNGYRQRLEAARGRGITVAQRQVAEVVRQQRAHAGEGGYFAALRSEGVGDASLQRRIVDGAASARSALAAFAEYLEKDYLPDAVERDAVGEERYVRLARRFLGSELDPVATYRWGWDEVARLRSAMERVADAVQPGASAAEAVRLLTTDPSRAAGSQEEFRRIMAERQELALGELDGPHFDVPELIKTVEVKISPPGGPLGAYYVAPSEDYTRPGTVWFSLGERTVVPLFDQVSTAYHEGFPGHHLQAGLQMNASRRVTRYQKLAVWYSGSGEGWALYAEDLMEELGYLERPDYLLGKLAGEMLRACRVVIDIGSHLELPIPRGQPFHPGEQWTFETGSEMLTGHAALTPAEAVSEMNRYLGWPGQAISYKVGQQAIRDLRTEEEARPGFDLKSFHARLLEVGAIGLDHLRAWMVAG